MPHPLLSSCAKLVSEASLIHEEAHIAVTLERVWRLFCGCILSTEQITSPARAFDLWEAMIATTIATLLGCVLTPQGCFEGRRESVLLCVMLTDYLIDQCHALHRQRLPRNLTKVQRAKMRREYRREFNAKLTAWVDGVKSVQVDRLTGT